jgi:hypothetical protein
VLGKPVNISRIWGNTVVASTKITAEWKTYLKFYVGRVLTVLVQDIE